MIINAGKLDRHLTVLTRSVIKDEYSQDIETFTKAVKIWGQRLEMRTQDAARAGQRGTFAVTRYLIRYCSGLDTTMRVEVDGRLHDIIAIDEPDRRATMVLTVEEVTREETTGSMMPLSPVSIGGE